MKPIYLTDLDHTFLRTDQTVSAYSQKIWNQKSTEALLSVATARSFSKTQYFLKKLHLAAPMILLDGSMVVTPDKELIDLKLVNKTLGDAIIDEGLQFGISPFIIALKDMDLNEAFLFPSNVNLHQNAVLDNYKNDPRMQECQNIRAMEMNLKLVYFAQHEILEPLTKHLRQTFGAELEYKLSPEKYSDGWFLTILHPQGDKAHALQTIADYLGRETEDFTVFGDSINDLGMFDKAGTAIAVKNALDEVKEKADIVLPHTNDEDAVAKYLKSTL
ncbi:MAG TPA: HAD-IIB family hydrolase [Epsilonproteobacteria bacterium]|nr:HAD-IIB family hydrolase [Campylobacterota bacterium]HHD72409.1 HAD-IIB family hydrolase [Campylobacterota bacterium]